ncbi:FAD linked oxidase domain protein [Methylobacterium sp. 4-46]|uniref:FAD-binding and (Fe-S)-binding domain-containing protein n=1 Tax=unclassified Methylobacterium TaxID=2615210 RepID=UPI000165C97B|nr:MULTISPECIES: FAD-binding and (Fe-S)-binding domain-containing protein [Methylobacterium]ACA17870.1 FAD linked oxidase domain protein [Methylobacterium sp. 4-46]WFT77172.1 FAD-binding and (Fe-S)-binding domain-containing protein [Methylobacterium nodulans]
MHGSLGNPGAAGREAGSSAPLERRLREAVSGEVLFGAFDRGRYATDASIYQIMPRGVVLPRTRADIAAVLAVAAEHEVPVVMRGGGTSQNGQPIGAGLVVDCSRHLDGVLAYDPAAGTVTVEPGTVLERLNARLKADGWFFPVEPSTASRCTIGGMVGNNSCGARSLRYGKMVDNVLGLDGLRADGTAFSLSAEGAPGAEDLAARMRRLAEAERDEIEARFPKVQRRVGGYNLDALLAERPNLAHLLVGSEGTLAATTAVTLRLARLPAHRVMGVCHFPSFRAAMETVPALVALDPVAVELVDNNVLVLGADIPLFRATLADIARGRPDCLLLVEFAGESEAALARDLARLDACMADHGFAGAVVPVVEPARQRTVWGMREACLNIMMSMRGDAKPVSFIEDCAVPLEHLADYTDAVTALFARHGTRGTWYAHASVGCLHVRPILNLKQEAGIAAMRAIAEETADLVRRFKGSYSGEHGDGISRSEFIAPLFGPRLTRAFEAVKDAFDPENRLNPGKIVRPLRMDDRGLMRFPAGYRVAAPAPALDWSAWGGLGGAVEMCNNNGTCRSLAGGVMCPSYRATRSEEHLTRGRANTLRLALSGQLGPDALTAPETKRALDLCVSCKGCRRECPTGVDMARMKIEVLHHYHARHGLPLRERLVAHLPRYAGLAARLAPLLNLRNRVPALARLGERHLGLSARRALPRWRRPFAEAGEVAHPADVAGDFRDVVLFADTFNRAFERENLEAAETVLRRAGYRLHRVAAPGGARPLCCGRTYLSVGDVPRARAEARRTLDALLPFVRAGARVVGLEPSCLLTLRDEFAALLPPAEAAELAAASLLFEELLAADLAAGRIALPLADQGGRVAHLHGHCHQKAFGAMGAVETVLRQVPGLDLRLIESSCCGMAGAFGYGAATYDASVAMAELSLFPALRRADPDDLVVADGTSCRHQIRDGLDREALHVARVLCAALRPEPRQKAARPIPL